MEKQEILDYIMDVGRRLTDDKKTFQVVHIGPQNYLCKDEIPFLGVGYAEKTEGEFIHIFYFGKTDKRFFKDEKIRQKKYNFNLIDLAILNS